MEKETRYVLYLTEKDGRRTIRDTFFGTLLSHPYEKALLSWLQKSVPECVGCRAFFDCAVDEAYTEASLQAVREALLAGEDALANFTELYVDGTACGVRTYWQRVWSRRFAVRGFMDPMKSQYCCGCRKRQKCMQKQMRKKINRKT